MISLPPRLKKGCRFDSAELMTPLSDEIVRSMSDAALKRRQSQFGSLNTMYLNASLTVLIGWGPASVAQPSSEPGCSNAGKTTAPVFGCLTGSIRARAVSTCADVRQDGLSASLHSSTFGSKWQRVGSSSTPSLTASCASHACSTAS